MRRDDASWPLNGDWLDIAWVVFALLNLGVMVAIPTWETIPFHFIWISLTLLYGFRVWSLKRTGWILAAVVFATGTSIVVDAISGTEPLGEMAEVPLMTAMFVLMVWHANRRAAALEEVQRVSETNTRMLERERSFLQDASHELRTPITVALGHAELIARATPDAKVREDAHVVVDELGRLRALADRLLLLASAEQPSFLLRRPVAPSSLVEEALRRWSPISRRWSLQEEPAPPIDADQDRVAAALDALIENAVDHTGEDDSIVLGSRRQGDSVVITVADTGTGISPDRLEHIFGRFARADTGRDRPRGGVGLGLSIAKAIAEAHGGDLRVRSTLGEGSVFELILPARGGPPLPSGSPSTAPAVPDPVPSR
jgi:signal transduction histidine kinase